LHENVLGFYFLKISVCYFDCSVLMLISLHIFSLEVHLSKIEWSHWPELVPGDSRGTRVFTAEQLSEISDQLEKFTGDKVQSCL